MSRIIVIASAKGGVGKTTLVANLAAALSQFGYSVVAVDGNLSTSNLGIHLGIPLYPKTIQDVLKGKVAANDVIYHHKAGFKVVPADINIKKIITPKKHQLLSVLYKLVKKNDFVLIDSAAGLGPEALSALEAGEELITITNPEMPALVDALKLNEFADKFGTVNLGVVVNRVKNESHEPPRESIEDFLELPILGHVPEDFNVPVSIARGEPVVAYNPKSPAGQHFKAVAANLIGEDYKPKKHFSLFGWLK